MSVGPVTAFAPSTQPVGFAAPAPVRPIAPARPVENAVLGPAVSLEIGAEGEPYRESPKEPTSENRGYVRDAESQALVYQVVDPRSGDVVLQIPDEVVIKARAYAREAAANEAVLPGSAIEKRA